MTHLLDIEDSPSLLRYLRETGRIGPDEVPEMIALSGGVSNRTILVCRPGGESWVLKQALSKLRTKTDWYCDPARIHREALGMVHLSRLAPIGTIPTLLFEDRRHHLLAMTAVPSPHFNWKEKLLADGLQSCHIRQFASLLASIHRRSFEERDTLPSEFHDQTYFETLRLEPYYGYSAKQIPEAAEFLHGLVGETRMHRDCLVHGDYSPKNILVHGDRLVLLDHEVIHFGDGAFDLGFSMAHLLSKAHHLPQWRTAFAEAVVQYWDLYWERIVDLPWATGFPSRVVRHTLACLLARVAGRSPLEYLRPQEVARQRNAVLVLMLEPPPGVENLVAAFCDRLM